MTPKWTLIKRIVGHALDLPLHERETFVLAQCGEDAELFQCVGELLSVQSEVRLLDTSQLADLPGTMAASLFPDMAGMIVGSYCLSEEIGRGGMGVVYKADRCDGLYDKRVAVKLLCAKPYTSSRSLTKRFNLERRILARLDHPHIARLIDAGTTANGIPYFVMEYIDGIPFDEYARVHSLSITDRLQLFLQICAAVDYTHNHSILHCDIKTTNILVNREGVPFLLDFGISELGEHVGISSSHLSDNYPTSRIMTRLFASPEQVKGNALTRASDIYSLGVVLYHLLTGRSPYPPNLSKVEEVEKAIFTHRPIKPSNHFLSLGSSRKDAAQISYSEFGADRVSIKTRLSGNLDAIVEKALQKEPKNRYQTARALAAAIEVDLAHYRNGSLKAKKRVSPRTRGLGKTGRPFVGVVLLAILLYSFQSKTVAPPSFRHGDLANWVLSQEPVSVHSGPAKLFRRCLSMIS